MEKKETRYNRYYKRHRERRINDAKEYHKKNKDKIRETKRKYRQNNPDKIAHLKARRSARERGAKGSHTLKEWNDLKKKFNNRCAFCFKEKKLTKDHILPLIAGGTDMVFS
jgi:hypothetical protein